MGAIQRGDTVDIDTDSRLLVTVDSDDITPHSLSLLTKVCGCRVKQRSHQPVRYRVRASGHKWLLNLRSKWQKRKLGEVVSYEPSIRDDQRHDTEGVEVTRNRG